jgi:hypothetical protein
MIYSKDLAQQRFRDLEFSEMKWFFGAIALNVYLSHIWHMRSITLASYSLMLTIFSLTVTQILYISLFQIKFFSPLHNLAIIIIVGIASNNVLFIYDAWL